MKDKFEDIYEPTLFEDYEGDADSIENLEEHHLDIPGGLRIALRDTAGMLFAQTIFTCPNTNSVYYALTAMDCNKC